MTIPHPPRGVDSAVALLAAESELTAAERDVLGMLAHGGDARAITTARDTTPDTAHADQGGAVEERLPAPGGPFAETAGLSSDQKPA